MLDRWRRGAVSGMDLGGSAMAVSELVRAELRRVDWASLECGCGESAEHVPLLIETIITAGTPRDMIGYTLDGHVEESTIIFECTPPAVGVIMAALMGDLSTLARDVLLQTLSFVAAGAGDFELDTEGAGLGDACRTRAQEGFWGLVQLGLTGTAEVAETVADICEYFDLGGDKAAFYQAELRERRGAKTKRGRRV
ncbi:hypothetical protein ACN6K4_001345 [Streptomyces hayashii]|uniref:hypothetical protein n=1 Tax=Streptomyces hayashii TaxID=2839966 RepID=UPI00403CAC1A